ncbi:shikimate dehydrogenase family protein [Fulvivirgaceae bacterium LMO-SS25]
MSSNTILFALLGHPLSHSFSQGHFRDKFEKEGLTDHDYILLDLPQIDDLPKQLDKLPNLRGFNVTIPYKEKVIPFLSELDPSAERIGAVNVVKMENGIWKGYNSDYYGFQKSLEEFLPKKLVKKAIVLGSGGASKAAIVALEDLGFEVLKVSRNPQAKTHTISYDKLKSMENWADEYPLIVNATPLGTYPNLNSCPDLYYTKLSNKNLLYDMVYNPSETLFMKRGLELGAKVKNGLDMLHYQADKAWEIWQA